MEEKRTLQSWLAEATGNIPFKPDRKAVEAELREHMEDKTADLTRIFPDMTQEEAEERALSQMGDAREIGEELARIHRPWLGYLWRFTQVVLVLTVAIVLFNGAPRVWETVSGHLYDREFMEEDRGRLQDYYLDGVDPFETGGLTRMEGLDPVACELVAKLDVQDGFWFEGYWLSLEGAVIWDLQDADGRWDRVLMCDIWAQGLPWEPLGDGALRWVSAADSLGNHYPSVEEWVNDEYVRPGQKGLEKGVALPSMEHPLIGNRICLQIHGLEPGAEWVRLNHGLAGRSWSMTVPLGEEGGK